MRTFRPVLLALACIVAIQACDGSVLPTDPQVTSNRVAASAVVAAPSVLACAHAYIGVVGGRVGSIVLTPRHGTGCDASFRIMLGAKPQYDAERDVVLLPLVIENRTSRTLYAPVRIYGWEDSLKVLLPLSLARETLADSYVELLSPDSIIGSPAPAFARAALWRYDTLLSPAGAPQQLASGARSGIRWVQIKVKPALRAFSAHLQAQAAIAPPFASAETIFVFREEGVLGSPATHVSANAGATVAYDFTPAPGYTNVQVRLDGFPAPVAGSVVAGSSAHVLTATADRTPVVPAGAEALYAAARNVLTASDVPVAYQAYLDAAFAYRLSVGTGDEAERAIAAIETLVFDFLEHEEALRRVDAALANHSFRIGPDASGRGIGPPIFSPEDTMVIAYSRAKAGVLSRAKAGIVSRANSAIAEGDTIEPTIFLHVNGVHVQDPGSAKNASALGLLIRGIPGLNSGNIVSRHFYNRTLSDQPPTPAERERDCIGAFLRLARFGYGADNSMGGYMATCMREPKWYYLSNLDLVESVRGVWSALFNTPATEVDAAILAHDIERYRNQGAHVIVVPHSQGNLMTNQALRRMRERNIYRPASDTSCIAVMSLASPVSANWVPPLPAHNLEYVLVDGDPVPALGFNSWERTATEHSRSVDEKAKIIEKVSTSLGAAYRAIAGVMQLHPMVTSYLEGEARVKVQAGLGRLYGACSVQLMEPTASPVTGTVGNRVGVDITYRNAYGDKVFRSALPNSQWSSADSTLARPEGAAIFRGLREGSTTVTATRLNKSATATVQFVPVIPPDIFGTWTGTWRHDLEPGEGDITMRITGNSFSFEVIGSWAENGKTINAVGGSGGENIVMLEPSSSGIRVWMTYQVEPNGFWFYKHFILTTRTGSKTATGVAGTGSGTDGWTIQMTKP